MSVFSERFALAMKQRGLTQAELVALTSIPKSAISQYLDGRFKPKRDRAIKIAATLGVDPAWLLGFSAGSDNDAAELRLSDTEIQLVRLYRASPELRRRIDRLLSTALADGAVFRAAKTDDGKSPPEIVTLDKARIARLLNAPETNEDL